MSSNLSKLFMSAVALRGCESWKEWNNAICSNVDRPRDYHIKWGNSERERQIWYHLYVDSKNTI